jgi:cytochrome oxidase Cu insertion factor (SCO1/SenC/PrrC family)
MINKKWSILFYIPILSLLILSCTQKSEKDKRVEEHTKSLTKHIGEKFQLKNVIDSTGKIVELDFTKSDITIIDFWFTECRACIEEMNQFSQLLPGKKGKISLISISINQFWLWKATLTNHTERFSFLNNKVENWKHYTLLSTDNQKLKNEFSLDRQSELAQFYDVTFYPAYFVLDKNGIIQSRPISAVDFIKHYN